MRKVKYALGIYVIVLLQLISQTATGQVLQVTDLKTEHLDNPIGMDTPNPRFSWKVLSVFTRSAIFVLRRKKLIS